MESSARSSLAGLRAPLSALPDLFSALAHAHVALVRIGAFLDRPDAEPTEMGAEMSAEMSAEIGAEKRDAYAPPSDGPALQMSGVALAWRVPPPRSVPPPPPPPYAAVFRGAGFVALPSAYGAPSASFDDTNIFSLPRSICVGGTVLVLKRASLYDQKPWRAEE